MPTALGGHRLRPPPQWIPSAISRRTETDDQRGYSLRRLLSASAPIRRSGLLSLVNSRVRWLQSVTNISPGFTTSARAQTRFAAAKKQCAYQGLAVGRRPARTLRHGRSLARTLRCLGRTWAVSRQSGGLFRVEPSAALRRWHDSGALTSPCILRIEVRLRTPRLPFTTLTSGNDQCQASADGAAHRSQRPGRSTAERAADLGFHTVACVGFEPT